MAAPSIRCQVCERRPGVPVTLDFWVGPDQKLGDPEEHITRLCSGCVAKVAQSLGLPYSFRYAAEALEEDLGA